jgi:dihydrofolate reductase
MIVATSLDGGLGLGNTLPWNIPEDLAYFKSVTQVCSVVMGRNTFDSLNRHNGLPNRTNYVLTSNKLDCGDDVVVISNVDDIINLAKNETVWVIGGIGLYVSLFNDIKELHHTEVNGIFEADKYLSIPVLLQDRKYHPPKSIALVKGLAEVKVYKFK